MRYHWALLRARWKGLKVRRDDVMDVAGDLIPSLRRARVLEGLGNLIYV